MNYESQANTPDLLSARKQSNVKAIQRLQAAVDAFLVADSVVYMNEPPVHQLIAALTTILKTGIDSTRQQASPLNEESRCFFAVMQSVLHQKKSTKFIATIQFLKTEKMKFQIWLLLELYSGDIRDLLLHPEFQAKYQNTSILRQCLSDILDTLDTFYFKKISLKGDLFKRFDKFIDITIEIHQASDDERQHAPAHKRQDLETPEVFLKSKSPSMVLEEDHVIEDVEDCVTEPVEKPATTWLTKAKNKRSQRLLREKFQMYIENYHYLSLLSPPEKGSSQNTCHFCKSLFKKSWWRPSNAIYCHFSGKYFCPSCIDSDLKQYVPYKVAKSFDLKQYVVNKEAYEEIEKSMTVPHILIHYSDDIVFSNEVLYDFLILKRSLHLMYDKLCEMYEFPNLKGHKNLLLGINLFSLKDFLDIYTGELRIIAQEAYMDGLKHIESCEQCKKIALRCRGCKSDRKIYLFDIPNTQYCAKCKALYHRSCFTGDCVECKKRNEDDQVN